MSIDQVACGNCGTQLQVPDTTRYVTCGNCRTSLVVRRSGNTIFTEPVAGASAAPPASRATSPDLRDIQRQQEINRLENELNRLDIDWEREKEGYKVTGRYGHRSLPSKGGSVIGGVVITVFGLFWTFTAFGMSTGFGRDNPGNGGGGPGFPFSCFPFFGIVFIAVGIGTSIYAYNKQGGAVRTGGTTVPGPEGQVAGSTRQAATAVMSQAFHPGETHPVTTEDAFLRSICDDINDDLRRLVFADWLDERGDPRGEWLRIGCELAELGPKAKRRKKLEARKRELQESHRESLTVWERRFAVARIKDKVRRVPDSHWMYDKRATHEGRLNPALSEDEVVAFEQEWGVTLPEEYRTFLLEVGNGGLGPGNGVVPLAEAVGRSPTDAFDQPFPFSFRQFEERRAGKDYSEELDPTQPGLLWLADPCDPWASVYLVVSGEDRGLVWAFGHIHGGWMPEAPTWDEDETQIDKPPRRFLRWYEDWLDVLLAKAAEDESG